MGSDRWWLYRLAPLRCLSARYTRPGKYAREPLRHSPSTAPPFAVRSDPSQAIRNCLAGDAELSRHGRLACLLDQFGPLAARGLELGFKPRDAPLERVQVPLLGRRQVPSRSRHAHPGYPPGRSTKGILDGTLDPSTASPRSRPGGPESGSLSTSAQPSIPSASCPSACSPAGIEEKVTIGGGGQSIPS